MEQLYKISDKFLGLKEAFESGNIDDDAFNDTIEAIEMDFSEKVGNILTLRASFKSKVESIKAEKKRLSELQTTTENAIDRLEEYLRYEMGRTGIKKVQDDKSLRQVSLSDTAPKVLVKPDAIDYKAIPCDYVTEQVNYKVDFTTIKNDLISGKEIKGFSLADGKRKLTIK